MNLHELAQEWGNERGATLAALASVLRAVYQIHQSAHWQSRGASFYGDHLMFQRAYGSIAEEIDSVAERAVSQGSDIAMVDPVLQAEQTARVVRALAAPHAVASVEDLVALSVHAEEFALLRLAEALEADEFSVGTENLVQGIADSHEKTLYLLTQRAS